MQMDEKGRVSVFVAVAVVYMMANRMYYINKTETIHGNVLDDFNVVSS